MLSFTECYKALHWGNKLRIEIIKSKPLVYLILLAILVSVFVGLALFLIDANIHSALDGIWSAWVTMTHVGFGDVVPTSFFGRLLAAALILFGLVFFSLFTALVSVTLLDKSLNALSESMQQVEQKDVQIQGNEERVLAEIARLHERMSALEHSLLNNAAKTEASNFDD